MPLTRDGRLRDWATNAFWGVVVVTLVFGNIYQDRANHALIEHQIAVGNAHHQQTEAILSQHHSELSDIANLATVTNRVVASLPKADANLAAFAVFLVESELAICHQTGATCPPAPNLTK